MSTQYSKKFLAASLLKCAEGALLYFRELPEGGCVVIAPDGRKLRYTDVQLADEAQRLAALEKTPAKKEWVTPVFELESKPVTRKKQEIARAEIAQVLGLEQFPFPPGDTPGGDIASAAPGAVTQGDNPSGELPADPRGAVTRSKRSESAEAAYQKRQQKKKGKR